MRKLLAFVPAGILGFAGYAIAFRAIPPGSLATSIDEIARTLGYGFTGSLVFSVGIVLTWLMLRKAEKAK
jgi:hypothetical protein